MEEYASQEVLKEREKMLVLVEQAMLQIAEYIASNIGNDNINTGAEVDKIITELKNQLK